MGPTNEPSGGQPAWQSDQAPCLYCGQVIARTEERCPHCKTSFSLAVRKASREVLGPWYYLDPRNPSGRGVTFETLIKMIEKGRLKADSIVRGPTTNQDWMYAAETPRLAKYLSMCPHCFAEAKPEDTYCTRCQLNMNQRPADARPGVPPELVKEPVHQTAYEMEKQLAGIATPAEASLGGESLSAPGPAARPALAPAGAPGAAPAAAAATAGKAAPREAISTAAAAAAAMAAPVTPGAERPTSISLAPRRRKPNLWIILVLTWVTLVPLLLILLFTSVFPAGLRDRCRAIFGMEPLSTEGAATTSGDAKANDEWLNEQLREVDRALAGGDYKRALEMYDTIIAKTGDMTWKARKDAIAKQMAEAERKDRLAKLKARLELAENAVNEHHYDDALAVLRNIGAEDRAWLVTLGVSVKKMEDQYHKEQADYAREKRQEEMLQTELAKAADLRAQKRLSEALDAYKKVKASYPAKMLADAIDMDGTIRELTQLLAAAKPPTPTPTPPDSSGTKPPPVSVTMPPEQAAAAIADILTQAATLEKAEKFKEQLDLLESIKTKFEQKYWPTTLDDKIKQVKDKKEAMEFFGVTTPKKPPAKAP
jgi:tetratricopeptide (TPR) repeat protein